MQPRDQSSLQHKVKDYISLYGDSYKDEDEWWGDKRITWRAAIERAWGSRLSNEKMHGHQCRVSKKLPKGIEVALGDNKQPENFDDFQSVHDWVQSVVDRVKGLGPTTAYDVARRLGVWLELKPVEVYLHAGAAVGARRFGIKGNNVPLSAFPKEIQKLGATHAENFLCIYKDSLPSGLNML